MSARKKQRKIVIGSMQNYVRKRFHLGFDLRSELDLKEVPTPVFTDLLDLSKRFDVKDTRYT